MARALPVSSKRWLLTALVVVCAVSLAAAPRSSTAPPLLSPTAEEVPPNDLRIGDIQFQVKMEPFPNTYAGMTHFDTRIVQIDPSSLQNARRRVYLHEMLHVAWHEGKPSADKAHKYTEEEAIQALTPGLLKMLAENPQAVEYLRK